MASSPISSSAMAQLHSIDRPLLLQQVELKKKAVSGFSTLWRHESVPSLSKSTTAFSSQWPAQPVTEEVEKARVNTSIMVSVVSSMSAIPQEDWDACAIDSSGLDSLNPFLLHAFLSSLEDSGSAIAEKGWQPQHLVARDESGGILGAVPLYLKSHSYGEYVFDHSWASAYYHFGRSYYPKLQSCVPFTPVTGPRILLRKGPSKAEVASGLLQSLQELAHQFKVSSLHITFPTEEEWKIMGDLGFLQRVGMQYHWLNDGYESFDEFLMALKQSKRKTIRQERKKVQAQGLQLRRLRGGDIKAQHWDAFYEFYRNTTDNKWGHAYLTRDFFHMLGSRMGDRILLIVAEEEEELVAGALNVIGGDTLFGRLWGCHPKAYYPNLHFETCYYQAIEAAIEWGLKKVEAGAQGEHKLQRGYMPTTTYSAHYFPNDMFKQAVEEFLKRESSQVNRAKDYLTESGPFKGQTT
ncbi:hypothetical protein GOP47_0000430 [Adiantum capillus-veneris]|uniref:Acyl-CoA N-acyltransferase n=1 Tax=Adiantum capillus-veneris TaxID=13818 RepID=A0A9D4VEQ1_ADICA|nr:hypothetical protein GOP47_0000430 [Adiantum capillus-veneris]